MKWTQINPKVAAAGLGGLALIIISKKLGVTITNEDLLMVLTAIGYLTPAGSQPPAQQ